MMTLYFEDLAVGQIYGSGQHRVEADRIKLQDGGRIRERLLALSDCDFSFTYEILESPMGVSNYVATIRLIPVTDGDRTLCEWSAHFDCPPDRADALVKQIGQGVFQRGFDALKQSLRG